jgi:hypothetical protein
MKNIELLELEGKIKNPIMEFLLEHDDYLEKEQIDAILTRGETGLEDLRLILKAYNQHYPKLHDSKNSLVFIVHVISFLAELKDEFAFDDMMVYLKTDAVLAEAAWNDSYMEDFPRYWSLFPDKIEVMGNAFYDTKITIEAKSALMTGLKSTLNFYKILKIKNLRNFSNGRVLNFSLAQRLLLTWIVEETLKTSTLNIL